MARPQKEGLDYFPLDVDIDQDDKIALIESQYGIEGFAIVIKIMMKIYKTSYFYEWTEREQLLFSKRVNVDINRVNVVINDCIKWQLFDEILFNTHKILTSKGIQRRYLEAVGRRQKVEMYREYLLLDKKTVNAYKNLVIVDINPIEPELMSTLIPKVKESKVKETKGEERKEEVPTLLPLFYPTPLHKIIANEVSELTYRMWLMDAEIVESNNVITITVSSDMAKSTISTGRCMNELNWMFTPKKIIVKVKGEDKC